MNFWQISLFMEAENRACDICIARERGLPARFRGFNQDWMMDILQEAVITLNQPFTVSDYLIIDI